MMIVIHGIHVLSYMHDVVCFSLNSSLNVQLHFNFPTYLVASMHSHPLHYLHTLGAIKDVCVEHINPLKFSYQIQHKGMRKVLN